MPANFGLKTLEAGRRTPLTATRSRGYPAACQCAAGTLSRQVRPGDGLTCRDKVALGLDDLPGEGLNLV